LGILLAGCSPSLTQSEIKFLETRQLDLAYDDSFKAAANGLFALGFTVDHSDKESGIVTGKRKDPQVGAKVAGALLFGVVGLLATGDREESVSFMITKVEPTLTELRMKLLVDGKPVTDRTMMTKVWQQIEREAMLAAPPSDSLTTRTAASTP
jgi:hypothetical protein